MTAIVNIGWRMSIITCLDHSKKDFAINSVLGVGRTVPGRLEAERIAATEQS